MLLPKVLNLWQSLFDGAVQFTKRKRKKQEKEKCAYVADVHR